MKLVVKWLADALLVGGLLLAYSIQINGERDEMLYYVVQTQPYCLQFLHHDVSGVGAGVKP